MAGDLHATDIRQKDEWNNKLLSPNNLDSKWSQFIKTLLNDSFINSLHTQYSSSYVLHKPHVWAATPFDCEPAMKTRRIHTAVRLRQATAGYILHRNRWFSNPWTTNSFLVERGLLMNMLISAVMLFRRPEFQLDIL
ncbi:uncharacterized protein ARMOST_18248 [Armillaria ostoyae]|uniref:Uncharacterized protein n=1 Tax=Armillaria ostoyae TaxID=47428 RepID=A0A284S1A0_ARMOS|nr:uncharacterized protein ARMOST_18248 [Armillaria ostoyae]